MSLFARIASVPREIKRGYLFIFLGSVCISFAAFFVRDANVDPSAVAFYRLLSGAAALFVVGAVRRVKLALYPPAIKIIAAAGLFFCCDLLFWHGSIVLVGPGIATILTNFQIIVLALFGYFFLHEKISLPQKLSIPLALVGLALLLGIHTGGIPGDILKGTVLGLLSAVFYSGYVLSLRRSGLLPVRMHPVANIAWVSLFSCAFVGIYCLAAGISLAIPDVRTGLTLACLGVFCQSIGWFLLSIGLPFLPPFRAGLIMLTQPALSYLWEILLYGTVPGVVNILGAVLAIAAIGMGIYSGKDKAGR